jgi:leader peptidase (prepilin peptidase) / N-methyltransferase
MSDGEADEDTKTVDTQALSLRPNLVVLIFGSVAIALISFAFLPRITAVFSTILGGLMVAGADIDSRTFLLPDTVTLGALVVGLGFAMSVADQGPQVGFFAAVLQASCVATLLFALRFGYQWLRGREGLGLGDVKLGAAIGVWLPLDLTPICFALAGLAALTFIVVTGRRRKIEDDMKLPFGAFLCPALWLIFFVTALPD